MKWYLACTVALATLKFGLFLGRKKGHLRNYMHLKSTFVQVRLPAYSVGKLAFSRNSLKFAEFDLGKLLILLGHVSAETLEIQQWGVFQQNRPRALVDGALNSG